MARPVCLWQKELVSQGPIPLKISNLAGRKHASVSHSLIEHRSTPGTPARPILDLTGAAQRDSPLPSESFARVAQCRVARALCAVEPRRDLWDGVDVPRHTSPCRAAMLQFLAEYSLSERA